MSANPQTCENAVRTNAFARREPYPPAKSEVPQRKTAVTEYTAGVDWSHVSMPDEGNTKREMGFAKRCSVQDEPLRRCDAQAHIDCARRMSQQPDRDEVGPCFCVGADILQTDSTRTFQWDAAAVFLCIRLRAALDGAAHIIER